MEISKTILYAINEMNNVFKDIILFDIVSSDMEQKYPDSYAKNGYWGVRVNVKNTLIDSEFNFYLKNQEAEDINIYNSHESKVMDLVRDDFPKMVTKAERIKIKQERKDKLDSLE